MAKQLAKTPVEKLNRWSMIMNKLRAIRKFFKWDNLKDWRSWWPLVTQKRFIATVQRIQQSSQVQMNHIQQEAGRNIREFKILYAPTVSRLVKVLAVKGKKDGKKEPIRFWIDVDWGMVRSGKTVEERYGVIEVLADGARNRIREILEKRLKSEQQQDDTPDKPATGRSRASSARPTRYPTSS